MVHFLLGLLVGWVLNIITNVIADIIAAKILNKKRAALVPNAISWSDEDSDFPTIKEVKLKRPKKVKIYRTELPDTHRKPVRTKRKLT